MRAILTTTLLIAGLGAQDATTPFRVPIRSITRLHGTMTNTLTGIGLVTGLNGTGSTDRATRQVIANFVAKFDLKISEAQISAGAAALVSVSAELPSFAHVGTTVDVRVKAISEVVSLEGGYLEHCPLVYFDGDASTTYVTASGPISTGGIGVATRTSRVTRDYPTSGRVERGGKVVTSITAELLSEAGDLELLLQHPDLRTAAAIARVVDQALGSAGVTAQVHDPALVRIVLPESERNRAGALRVLALVGGLHVPVHHPAKVVIDIDTGTLIAGEGVHISPCVIATSDVTISIVDEDEIVQPFPGLSQGETARVARSRAEVTIEDQGPVALAPEGATVAELVESLRGLGLSTRQLIEVFQMLDAGHFLKAPLEIR